MKRRRLLALGALLATVGATTALAATTVTVAPNVFVTSDTVITRTNQAPYLLADRNNANTLYLADVELQRGECRFYISRDRGLTWTKGSSPQVAPLRCGPGSVHPQYIRTQLAQSSNGTLYYGFSANDPGAGGSRSAFLGRSTDQGQTWQTTVIDRAPSATTAAQIELDFIVHIAIDPSNPNRVYVDWRRDYPSPSGTQLPDRPYVAVSTDGGATFGTPSMIANRNVGDDAPWLVAAQGKIYAGYLEFPASSSAMTNFYVASSSDQGQTWSEVKFASAPAGDSVNLIYDAGRGKFNVVWDDNHITDWDVFLATSSDGVHWGSPVRLNSDPSSDGRGHLFPHISLAPAGRIDVAWYDFRNDPYPAPPASAGGIGNRNDVYLTSSTDGGATWSRNLQVNGGQINRLIGTWNNEFYLVDPPALASTDDGALLAWSDTRNGDEQTGTQDIYFGAATFSTPTTPAVATTYSTRDVVVVGILVGVFGLGTGAGLAMLFSARAMRRRLRTPT